MARSLQVAILLVLCWTAFSEDESDLGRLRRKLLEKYDKDHRPVVNSEDTVAVKFAFHVRHLFQLDKNTETLSAEGVFQLEWNDEFMVWNPAEYGNLTVFYLADHEIWQPDVYLYRSVGENFVDDDKSTFVRITSAGNVTWTPPASLKVPCVTSYRYYPFEKHWCEFEFGSWSHSGSSLFLRPVDDFTLDPAKVTGGEWRITEWTYDVKEHYIIDKYPYNSLNLTLAIQRTTSIHKVTSIVPVVISAALTLAGFWLDFWSTSRYVLGLGNLGIVALQLMDLGVTLPSGNDIPLIVQFSGTTVSMAALFLIVTMLLHSMQSRRDAPPDGVLRVFRKLPLKMLCLLEENDSPKLESSAQPGKEIISRDWNLICRVFDRIFFWIFSLIYVIVTTLLFSVV